MQKNEHKESTDSYICSRVGRQPNCAPTEKGALRKWLRAAKLGNRTSAFVQRGLLGIRLRMADNSDLAFLSARERDIITDMLGRTLSLGVLLSP